MVTRILTFYSSATDIIGNVAHFDYTLVVPLLLSFRMTYKVYQLLYAELLSQQSIALFKICISSSKLCYFVRFTLILVFRSSVNLIWIATQIECQTFIPLLIRFEKDYKLYLSIVTEVSQQSIPLSKIDNVLMFKHFLFGM